MTPEEKLRAIIARGKRRQVNGATEVPPPETETAVGVVNVMGTPARVYPARPECLEAGYCKWLTLDCGWYPITGANGLTGRCRERVHGAAGQARVRWALEQLDKQRGVLY